MALQALPRGMSRSAGKPAAAQWHVASQRSVAFHGMPVWRLGSINVTSWRDWHATSTDWPFPRNGRH